MGKNKILHKLKKALIVMMTFVTIAFMMPAKASADVLNDFISIILYIPDGIMGIVDQFVAGSDEFTLEKVNFEGWGGKSYIYNFIITPYEIFSSGTYEVDESGNYKTKLGLLDINFFSDKKITSDTWVSSEMLAPVIGNVYKGLESICLVLMMLVLMYTGIKILMSSIAEQQAKYKQLLSDWLVGFALLFIMHYIMSAIVNVNSLVIRMLNDNGEGDSHYVAFAELEKDDGQDGWRAVAQNLYDKAFNGEKYDKFKENRLCVVGDEGGYYTDGIDTSTGKLNLNDYLNYPGGNISNWGDNGVVRVEASVVNAAGGDDDEYEEYYNKAILKLNTMSYVRTISNFASSDNENVIFYGDGNGTTRADMASTFGYTAIYLFLVIETIVFLITYVKRVIHIAFLTFIAPLVAIMYPLDKIGDSKAQSFNTWFRDYLFNVLIQPFHLLIYIIFIVAAGQLITKNLIYTIAVYAYMVPAEKYMRKILGFEKSSNSSGGPVGGLLGTSLAMDGLKRFTGLGPGPKGKRPSGGKEGSSARHKLPKVKPGQIAHTPYPGGGGSAPSSDGSTGLALTGGAPGASGTAGAGARGGSGSTPSTPGTTPTTPSTGGGSRSTPPPGSSSRRTPPPGSSGPTPSSGGPKPGFGHSVGRVIGKRINRALTGGKYDNLRGHGWTVAGNLAKKGGRTLLRGAGTIGMGALGTAAGVATAMATGKVDSIWKGATIGAAAGNKTASNVFDRGADMFKNIGDDISSDRAKYEPEYLAKLRRKEASDTISDELADLPDGEREKYEKATHDFAPYINIKSVDDLKPITSAADELLKNDEYNDGSGNLTEEGLQEVLIANDDAKAWSELKKNKDKYMSYTEEEIRSDIIKNEYEATNGAGTWDSLDDSARETYIDGVGKNEYEATNGAGTWDSLDDKAKKSYIDNNTHIAKQAHERSARRYKAALVAQSKMK